jgi:polyisoprenoid-binding protein YceI
MSTWLIDPIHSEVKFKIRHLVVSNVTGHFGKFDATITTPSDDFSDASISFNADVASIDTRNEQRDGHLKSADFFNVEQFPKMQFVSKEFKKEAEGEYTVVGDLSLHGVTKEVKLHAQYNGTVAGLGGGTVAGFEITGKLSRTDFGLTWNAVTEAGHIALSDDVKIDINAELIKQ